MAIAVERGWLILPAGLMEPSCRVAPRAVIGLSYVSLKSFHNHVKLNSILAGGVKLPDGVAFPYFVGVKLPEHRKVARARIV